MGFKDWEAGMLTDDLGRLGRPVPSGGVAVPSEIDLNVAENNLLWSWSARKEGRRIEPTFVEPGRRMLNSFVRLWSERPSAVLQFARKWGPLALGEDEYPCVTPGPVKRSESITTWHYYSRRAFSVLNLIAALKQGKIGVLADWEALRGTRSRVGDLIKDLRRYGPVALEIYAAREYPFEATNFGKPRFKRSLDTERIFLGLEVMLWLRLGRVGFATAANGDKWELFIDYHGCMLSAIALQLALVLANADSLHMCSGCGLPYVREMKPPKPGQANYCSRCGRTAAVRDADKRRREKLIEAQRLHIEGKTVHDIAETLNSTIASVKRWLKKGNSNVKTRKR